MMIEIREEIIKKPTEQLLYRISMQLEKLLESICPESVEPEIVPVTSEFLENLSRAELLTQAKGLIDGNLSRIKSKDIIRQLLEEE